jgi:ribonuclease VapC
VSERYVLDASAILCLINGELGAGRVENAIAGSVISAVNLSEVVAKHSELGPDSAKAEQMLASLDLRIRPFDTDAAYAAGGLRSSTKAFGLSFADRACLALAQGERLPALTADRAWQGAGKAIGVSVELIR